MTDWDEDSEQLRANLRNALLDIRRDARARVQPSVEHARGWQRAIMDGLNAPEPHYIGAFRGEAGVEGCEVEVGAARGVPSDKIAAELARFEDKLRQAVQALDDLIAPDQDLNADQLAAVIDLCAWAHSEWVRIHPFANGNGRTARLWANGIAMRYGLPPFVRLRPRPDGGYGDAAAAAMAGQWRAAVPAFQSMYREAVRR